MAEAVLFVPQPWTSLEKRGSMEIPCVCMSLELTFQTPKKWSTNWFDAPTYHVLGSRGDVHSPRDEKNSEAMKLKCYSDSY